MKKTINYVWVGQPTKNDPTAIAGHDVAGPIKMARALKIQAEEGEEVNPIKFWCLEEHTAFYQKQFALEEVDIEVCSIEGLLREDKEGPLVEYAEWMQTFMAESLEELSGRVAYKDVFSLFLLVSQGGYFFDTNVFPKKDKVISLLDEPVVTTAKSGFQDSNDFYIMYSPEPMNTEMLKILDAWIADPQFCNLSVFKVTDVPYLNEEEMGVNKVSYKSYFMQESRGLFYWFNRNFDEFAEHLKYGDINEQRPYTSSGVALHDFSLCYLKPPITEEKLLSIPFATNEAYVSTTKRNAGEIYYVNKKERSVALVYDGFSNLFDSFPKSETIYQADPRSLVKILSFFNSFRNDIHPEYIINTGNCTLLNHAVLSKKIDHVKLLIQSGARLDLVATYEMKPSGKMLELTARELAEFLNYGEIASLLQHHEEIARTKIQGMENSDEEVLSKEKEEEKDTSETPNLFGFFKPNNSEPTFLGENSQASRTAGAHAAGQQR